MSDEQRAGDKRLLTALLGGPVRLIHEKVIDPVRRRARRRAGAWELARLDDRLLRDIGLTRSQVHAAAFGPVGPSGHSPADSPRARPSGPGNVVPLKRRAIAEPVDEPTPAPLARRAVQS
jgi:uncharacterized protein YjiS (DUF1127 family)